MARRPFFIVPTTRYEYWVPSGVRSEKKTKTSPFLSFWYVGMPPATSASFIRSWRSQEAVAADEEAGPPRPALAGHRSQIPHSMRAEFDPTRRRLRKKQREAFARRVRNGKHVSKNRLVPKAARKS